MTNTLKKSENNPKEKHAGGRPITWTDEAIIELGEEMLQFLSQPGVWHICEFSSHKKKVRAWLYEVAREKPMFSEYLTRAQQLLGYKLFKQAMEKNPSQYIIQRWMPAWLEDRDMVLTQIREEATIKAEAAKEAMSKDPTHPYWDLFAAHMAEMNAKSSQS
jgi:hypothetical protein